MIEKLSLGQRINSKMHLGWVMWSKVCIQYLSVIDWWCYSVKSNGVTYDYCAASVEIVSGEVERCVMGVVLCLIYTPNSWNKLIINIIATSEENNIYIEAKNFWNR